MGRLKGSLGKKNKKILKGVTSEDLLESRKEDNIIEEKKIENIELNKEQKERQGKLKETLRNLNKNLGKDAIKYANEIEDRKRLSFGHEHLDKLTGGGIPEGTYSCFWGGKGTGKTTAIFDLMAKAQSIGKICAYINGERSYDPIWAKKRGINTDTLIIIDVETLEEGLDAILKLCREQVVDLIVFDSIHGLAPDAELYKGKAEEEKSTADSNMALRARALTQFFEMATAFVASSKCAILLVAQARMDLSGFVKLEHLTGGHALLHFSRLILKFRRGQKADCPTEKVEIDEVDKKGNPVKEDKQVGFDMVIKVEKSQLDGCIEGNEIHLPFYYLEGIKE